MTMSGRVLGGAEARNPLYAVVAKPGQTDHHDDDRYDRQMRVPRAGSSASSATFIAGNCRSERVGDKRIVAALWCECWRGIIAIVGHGWGRLHCCRCHGKTGLVALL